jgi:hypothetical protein
MTVEKDRRRTVMVEERKVIDPKCKAWRNFLQDDDVMCECVWTSVVCVSGTPLRVADGSLTMTATTAAAESSPSRLSIQSFDYKQLHLCTHS